MSSEYEVTMHSISIMYVKLFEKLGWMIIANSNKDKEKTKMYLHTLKQVKKIIDNKHKSTKDKDKKDDLFIMSDNLAILIKHADNDFKNKKSSNVNKKHPVVKLDNIFEYDATFCGLSEWYSKMFKKIGWIILADKKGNTEKMHGYFNSLLKLYKSIELKHKKISDSDKKRDLEIMKDNLDILIAHVQKDFHL